MPYTVDNILFASPRERELYWAYQEEELTIQKIIKEYLSYMINLISL